jgi:hypothetical protein
MKCNTVRTKLGGYLDDAVAGAAHSQERALISQHLEGCGICREELQRFRKLSMLLSRVPRSAPPADLAVRIRVAAAQLGPSLGFAGRLRKMRDRAEILFENVFRPLSVPATGGIFSTVLLFALVLQLTVPGITLRAFPNDAPVDVLRPAELITLSDYPSSWAPEEHDLELSMPHGLMVDVTVDQRGQMADYQILSGPSSTSMRHQLDQMLLFSRFRPMLSFGRPTPGGHVILSFSAVRVRG